MPFRSASCNGEACTLCGAPADAKIGEEIAFDDPAQIRHNLTAYVCAKHFRMIFGDAGVDWLDRYRDGLRGLDLHPKGRLEL